MVVSFLIDLLLRYDQKAHISSKDNQQEYHMTEHKLSVKDISQTAY